MTFHLDQSANVAIVMNMFYTGLGIARSLGEQGVRVIGLASSRGLYGNFTRYAQVHISPDSREEPEALLEYLLQLGTHLPQRVVIFPTRDDDLRFLDRFRAQLSTRFILPIPDSGVLESCLNKWETFAWARKAGVAIPKCWVVSDKNDLLRIRPELTYPCVLKPISAYQWRQGNNWETVGKRKAVAIASSDELIAEYDRIAFADSRLLIQEMVPGPDSALYVAACYFDRDSQFVAGFTARKMIQVPEGFGTGCLVESIDHPQVLALAVTLLKNLRFTGIAEVEFKKDPASGEYKLIEINPRPWDQHRLGNACGVDLIQVAYADLVGRRTPPVPEKQTGFKWIAEDVFAVLLVRSLVRRKGTFGAYLRLVRGRRVYAISSLRDPLPVVVLLCGSLASQIIPFALQYTRSRVRNVFRKLSRSRGSSYENVLEKPNCRN